MNVGVIEGVCSCSVCTLYMAYFVAQCEAKQFVSLRYAYKCVTYCIFQRGLPWSKTSKKKFINININLAEQPRTFLLAHRRTG